MIQLFHILPAPLLLPAGCAGGQKKRRKSCSDTGCQNNSFNRRFVIFHFVFDQERRRYLWQQEQQRKAEEEITTVLRSRSFKIQTKLGGRKTQRKSSNEFQISKHPRPSSVCSCKPGRQEHRRREEERHAREAAAEYERRKSLAKERTQYSTEN